MNNIILAFLIMAFSIVNGQNVKIENGVEFIPEESDGFFKNIIDFNDNYIYEKRESTVGKGRTQILRKIDKRNFEVVYTIEYEYDQSKRNLEDETEIKTVVTDTEIFVFTRVFNTEDSKVYLLLRRFNANTGKTLGEQKILLEFESSKREASYINFYLVFSPDKSKMFLSYLYSKDFIIYDTKNFNKIASKSFSNKSYQCSEFNIDNSGNVLYLTNLNQRLSLISFELNQNASSILSLGFKIGRYDNYGSKLIDEKLYIYGVDSSNSIVNIQYDVKNKVVLYNTSKAFEDDILKKIDDYEDSRLTKGFNRNFIFNKTIISKEYIYIIVAHKFLLSVNPNARDFNYENELIVAKFKINGEFQWMKIVPKFNTYNTPNKPFVGYNIMINNNNLYFFYLDHIKNIENSDVENYNKKDCPGKYTEYVNNSMMVCTKISYNGIMTRQTLSRNNNWYYKPISENIINEKDKSILILMRTGDKQRYDKITGE